ncbi:hypothetical protein AB835_10005 [Candidatus Endobugula sertula]|uniref:Uncharacterized protein n=1 Tax=Candidatus Endobugula sertula TaxID=62101 RepID=A0A1D2QNS8_9GAMM|nr:hypothetical protein AB835_10005 [Candidatus Endobugula sertula]
MLNLKQKTQPILIILLILISSCSQEQEVIEEKIITVSTKALADLLIDYTFHRPARAISLNDAVLSAELNASVEEIYVQVGDVVEKNAPLIKLDCRDEKHRLQQAEAQLAASMAMTKLSQLDYQRTRKLYQKKTTSKQSLDRLNSEHERNQANQRRDNSVYQLRKRNVEKCLIHAPFTAIITERFATIGQFATPSTNMVRLIDTKNMEVSAHLTSHEANMIAYSRPVYFLQDKKKYPLIFRVVTLAVDSIRRTQEVRLRFKNEKPLPGSSGQLVWTHPLPALPSEYLSRRDGKLGVLYAGVHEQKTVALFKVIEGAKEGQPVLVTMDSHFTEHSPILIDGRFGVNVGEEIQVSTPQLLINRDP